MKLPHLSDTQSHRFALTRAAIWAALVPISLLTGLKESLPFIVFVSLYANIASELSAAAGHGARREAADDEPRESS